MKKLTWKNFALGLAVVLFAPVWIPLALLMFVAAVVCEIGMYTAAFFADDA